MASGASVDRPPVPSADPAERVPHAAGLRPLAEGLDDALIWNLVDAAPDGMVMTDEQGQILLVNRRTEEMFGYDRGELLGRRVEELLPERLRAVHRAHRTRYRAAPTNRPMGAGLLLFGRRADGDEFPVEISLSPIPTDDGTLIVAAVRDVSERIAAEARAREIQGILDATHDGVSILDAQTMRFTYVNEGLVAQLGYDEGDLLGMTMLHVAPELDQRGLASLLARFEAGQRSVTFTTVHRRRDGTDVPVEIVMQAITDDDGRPRAYAKIARDVTERLEAEARHQRAEQELRVLEDRERLGRDLHDLVIQRLFAAGMAAQSLGSRLEDADLARRAAAIVDELDQTIREIRTVIFGLQSPTSADGTGLRRQLLAVCDDERVALGFSPRVRFDGPVDSVGDHVAHDVLAIVREALSNVARHAGATAVEIAVEAGDGLVVRVADDGVGLPAAGRGRGFGLRNMTERAEALGGTLDVRGGPQGGTVLEARIPV